MVPDERLGKRVKARVEPPTSARIEPQTSLARPMHWLLCPRRPSMHVTRSARPERLTHSRETRGTAARRERIGDPSMAHKQITKRYKTFWPGVALKYTGTLQYRFWRADRAQSGYMPRRETLYKRRSVRWLDPAFMSPSPPPHEFSMQEPE